MPRPNRARTIGGEENLAKRIRMEREKRGFSYEALAKEMTETGCPIQGSAIFKIEKADPPRRVTVNELVALADVFGVSADDLLTPVEVLQKAEGERVIRQLREARDQVRDAIGAAAAAYVEFLRIAAPDPELVEYVDNQSDITAVAAECAALVERVAPGAGSAASDVLAEMLVELDAAIEEAVPGEWVHDESGSRRTGV